MSEVVQSGVTMSRSISQDMPLGARAYDIASDSWKPTQDHLIVKQDELTPYGSFGLLVVPPSGIVDSQSQWGHTGTVVAAGPGRWTRIGAKQRFQAATVVPGQRITWGEFLPKAVIQHEGQRCVVITERDVCGILENEQESA